MAQTFLDRPDQDGPLQLAALEAVRAEIPALRARYRELTAWLTGWQALLDQALAEGRLGLREGEDEARRAYFRLAEGLANASVITLARTQGEAAGLEARVAGWPAFDSHLRGWHALRALRQVVGWSGARQALVSGRKPILVLSPEGEARRLELSTDLLQSAPLDFSDAARRLNQLAWGWQWRA